MKRDHKRRNKDKRRETNDKNRSANLETSIKAWQFSPSLCMGQPLPKCHFELPNRSVRSHTLPPVTRTLNPIKRGQMTCALSQLGKTVAVSYPNLGAPERQLLSSVKLARGEIYGDCQLAEVQKKRVRKRKRDCRMSSSLD